MRWQRGACLILLLVLPGCALVAPALTQSEAETLAAPRPAPLAPGLGFLNPLEMPRPEIEQACLALSKEQRERTHLFFINGLDPLYWSNLNSVVAYLQSVGFSKAKCLQLYEAGIFRAEIAELRKRAPEDRVVLVGYSAGANCARTMANQLAEDHVPLDLLVYIGGDSVFNTPESKPANTKRILNIRSNGMVLTGYNLFFKGEDLDGASNHHVNCRHIVLPARRQTVELMLTHLAELWPAPPASYAVQLGRPEPLR